MGNSHKEICGTNLRLMRNFGVYFERILKKWLLSYRNNYMLWLHAYMLAEFRGYASSHAKFLKI